MRRIFIDTNILIYYFSKDSTRFSLAEKLLNNPDFQLVTYIQVLSEFLSVILRKNICDKDHAKKFLKEIISIFEVVPFDTKDLERALDIKAQYQLSYYDSLIITNALKSNCSVLYTEDMHHGLKIEKKIKVINPFL